MMPEITSWMASRHFEGSNGAFQHELAELAEPRSGSKHSTESMPQGEENGLDIRPLMVRFVIH